MHILSCLLLSYTVLTCSVIPPTIPPVEQLAQFTLDNSYPIEYFYVDDTLDGNGTHFIFTEQDLESYRIGAVRVFDRVSTVKSSLIKRNLPSVLLFNNLRKDQWIHVAIERFPELIESKEAVVFGSMAPWLEMALIQQGAAAVTTVEYNSLTYPHSRISTVNKHQFSAFYGCNVSAEGDTVESSSLNRYDVAFSVSSFDHDGLGRYGDPLDPFGDFLAMQKTRNILKPGGYLFLTVPIGKDVTVFNLHRRYGPVRLPLLLRGWDVVERLGWIEMNYDMDGNWRQTFEPVFILRKPLNDTSIHINDCEYLRTERPALDDPGVAAFEEL